MSPSDTRFFTEDWTITLDSQPHLKFIHLTPTYIDAWLKILTNPLNRSFASDQDRAWDEDRLSGAKQRSHQRYIEARTKYHALEILVQVDGEFVGRGGTYEIEPNVANVGVALDQSVRGKGVGKATMQVLLRLSNELNVDIIEAGTMKANKPMRALAASLGLEETDEVKESPGKGVVAEVLFKNIEKERWKHLDMNVEFAGPALE